MQTINQIKLQARIKASSKLYDSENISFVAWGEAYVIQEHIGSFLNDMLGEIQDQIEEDLENV